MQRLKGRPSTTFVLWITEIAALSFAAGACGGDGDDGNEQTEPESPTAAQTEQASLTAPTDAVLLAIDARTGQELWRVRPPGGAVSPPVATDRQAFVVTSNDCRSLGGTLVAYDAATGDEQWRAPSERGCCSLLDARMGIVVSPGEKDIQGLDAATGKSRWGVELRERTDVALIDGENQLVVVEVAAYNARFRAVDRLTGQERWAAEMTLPGRFGPALAASTGLLFLQQPFGGQAGAWPLTALDLETGERRWVANVGGEGTYDIGLATNDDTAFVRFGSYTQEQIEQKQGFSTVAAFNAGTGEEI